MKKFAVLILCFLTLPGAAFAAHRARTGEFQRSWDFYRVRTAQHADVNERICILDRIFRKYRGDRYAMRLIQLKVERNFLVDWKSYLRQTKDGMSPENRRETLEGIRTIYLNTGIDLSMVDAELARLTSPVPAPAVSSPTAHEDVLLSTYTVPAATASLAPLTAGTGTHASKYFGFSAGGLGKYGLYGGEAIFNFTDRLSFAAGYGINTLLKTPNPASTARRETYSALLRYGDNVYVATGLLRCVCSGEAVAGNDRCAGSITALGFPLVIGVETGNKRGIFFSLEGGYTFYSGASERTLSATDFLAPAAADLTLEPPASGAWFGLGFGIYFF